MACLGIWRQGWSAGAGCGYLHAVTVIPVLVPAVAEVKIDILTLRGKAGGSYDFTLHARACMSVCMHARSDCRQGQSIT